MTNVNDGRMIIFVSEIWPIRKFDQRMYLCYCRTQNFFYRRQSYLFLLSPSRKCERKKDLRSMLLRQCVLYTILVTFYVTWTWESHSNSLFPWECKYDVYVVLYPCKLTNRSSHPYHPCKYLTKKRRPKHIVCENMLQCEMRLCLMNLWQANKKFAQKTPSVFLFAYIGNTIRSRYYWHGSY